MKLDENVKKFNELKAQYASRMDTNEKDTNMDDD